MLEEETVSVIVNGEDRLPGGLTVITKENFNEKEELMASGRSLVLMHEGEEWVREALHPPALKVMGRLTKRPGSIMG